MSRIEELERFIAKKKLGRARSLRKAENCATALVRAEDELAAIKAEASKPREYKFRLYGDILYSETSVSGTPITLIEKKPVRVTREKTSLMDKVWCKWSNDDDNVHAWVEALKAIGIDAIAAD